MDQEHGIDYSYIDDGIYIGTNQCCKVHFDAVLAEEGITADISLEESRIDQPFGVDFYIWLPTEDHEPPSPDQLQLGVSSLSTLVSGGRKIYVHCKNGHGRAPTLVAAYFIHKGMSADEAESLIKAKRPSIHLQESQREALRLYKTLHH